MIAWRVLHCYRLREFIDSTTAIAFAHPPHPPPHGGRPGRVAPLPRRRRRRWRRWRRRSTPWLDFFFSFLGGRLD